MRRAASRARPRPCAPGCGGCGRSPCRGCPAPRRADRATGLARPVERASLALVGLCLGGLALGFGLGAFLGLDALRQLAFFELLALLDLGLLDLRRRRHVEHDVLGIVEDRDNLRIHAVSEYTAVSVTYGGILYATTGGLLTSHR